MKIFYKIIFILLVWSTFLNNSFAQTIITVGPSGADYTTLETAVNSINTDYEGTITVPYRIELQSDYTDASESYPIVLNAVTGASATNTITIRPASNVTGEIEFGNTGTSTTTAAILQLSGIDYLTIDGRPDGTGSNKYIAFRNTTNPSTGDCGPAVSFLGDATYNTIQYCLIEAETEHENGVVSFYTCTSVGNDNNTITYCNISDLTTGGTSAKPTALVSSSGASTTISTNDVTISNCELFGCGDANNKGYIYLDNDVRDWTITGNSFYPTGSMNSVMKFIFFDAIDGNGGTGYTVSNNYFGGTAANCGGSEATWTGAGGSCIDVSSVATNTGTINVTGNTFSNIYFNGSSDFMAIDGTEGPMTWNISNNTFSSIRWGSSVTGSCSVFYNSTNNTCTFSNNTIGSTTNNNMAYADAQEFRIIYHYGTGTFNSSGNTFQQFHLSNTTTSDVTVFAATGGKGPLNSTDDIITEFEMDGSGTFQAFDYSNNTANSTVTSVQITNIKSNHTTSGYTIKGINLYETSANFTVTVQKCMAKGWEVSTSSTSTYIRFIQTEHNTTLNAYNNVFLFNNNGSTTEKPVYQVFEISSDNPQKLYHNTVHIYGTTATTSISSIISYDGTGSMDERNNVYKISQSNSASNYIGWYSPDPGTFTSTYNSFENVAADLFYYNSTFNTFAEFDALGTEGDNCITAATTIDSDGFVTTASWAGKNTGANLSATVTTDYLGNSRSTTPWMGAYEVASASYVWDGSESSDWKTGDNWVGGVTPTTNDNAQIPTSASYTNAPIIDEADAVCKALELQGDAILTVSSGKLAVNGAVTMASTSEIQIDGGELECSGKFEADGILDINAGTLDVDGEFEVGSTLTEEVSGGTIEVSGDWDGASEGDGGFTPSGGTVVLDGSTATNVDNHASATFYNLTLNKSSNGSTVNSNLTITNNLTVTLGSLTAGTYTINVTATTDIDATLTLSTGTLNADGTFDATGGTITVTGAATIELAGATVTSLGTLSSDNGTVHYNGDITQNILSDTYNNLTISSATGQTKAASGNITVNGNLTIDASATFNVGTTTLTVTGTTDINSTLQIGTGTADCNGTFDATGGTIDFTGAGNLLLGGATITSLGTLDNAAGTVNYDRAGVQTIIADDYYSLTIDGSATKTLGGAIAVDGNLTITTGTLDVSGTNYAITLAGDLVRADAGGFNGQGGTITFNGGATQKVNVTAAGGTTPADSDITYYNIVIDGTDVKLYYNKTNDRYINITDFTINATKSAEIIGN